MPPDTQNAFAAALLSPEVGAPPNIVDPEGRFAPKRFAVYRNNVIVSLIEALASTFPAVQGLVGEEFFKAMARQFARQNPPQSPLLFEYGRDFAEFVEKFEPARQLPFLPGVAQLDRAWLDAYHAADATALDASVFAQCDDEKLASATFTPHPALQIVSSVYPLGMIWTAGRTGQQPSIGAGPAAEWVLVARPDVEVQTVALPATEGRFFSDLADGRQLGEAAEAAMVADPLFDFAGALSRLISSGAFCAVTFS